MLAPMASAAFFNSSTAFTSEPASLAADAKPAYSASSWLAAALIIAPVASADPASFPNSHPGPPKPGGYAFLKKSSYQTSRFQTNKVQNRHNFLQINIVSNGTQIAR
jgi:hypothetical protein